MSTTILQIRKDHLPTTRWHERADEPLAPGQVRVRIDRFALTSNNITYAAFGEAMNYWRFYPTGEEGWGVIPVWGFATVVESTHPEVPVGERVYGYFPMASHTVLTPVRVSAGGWADGAPHRAELHPVYNQLTRCATDPFYTPDTEDVQALLRPLFITSWLIDDFLADNDFFGARVMLLSSASSKTAYGTAFQLAQREGIEVVGLTSPGNVAFCESLGCYTPRADLRPARRHRCRRGLRVCGLCRQQRPAPRHSHPVREPEAQQFHRRHARRAPGRRERPAWPARHAVLCTGPDQETGDRMGPGRAEPAPGRGLAGFFKGGGAARHALARGADASRPRGRGGRLWPGAVGPWRPAPGAHAAGLGRRTA
jgi:hypothetical protein